MAKSYPAPTQGIFPRSWRMLIRCIIHPLDSVRQVRGSSVISVRKVGASQAEAARASQLSLNSRPCREPAGVLGLKGGDRVPGPSVLVNACPCSLSVRLQVFVSSRQLAGCRTAAPPRPSERWKGDIFARRAPQIFLTDLK